MRQWRIAAALAMLAATAWTVPARADALRIDWLERQVVRPPVLSNMEQQPATLGLDGARLSVADINTTGKFTGMTYQLVETVVPPEGDFLPAAKAAIAGGARVLVVRAPTADLLALADLPEAKDVLIFNTEAPDGSLRGAECRANVLHTVPSYQMRTDALAQFLLSKRWTKLVLVEGNRAGDADYAAALKASLAKFGLKLAGEKTWGIAADMRRVAAAEMPLFTQDLPEHDVMLVADVPGDFARYMAYNTWLPRPLAGTEGMKPLGWAPPVEHFGASQLQSRFHDLAGREMTDQDFAAWVAVAALGEAATRAKTTDAAALRGSLLSPKARISAFLGQPLSFRDWDGQLRQPIPLVTERAVIAMPPLEGFLHQTSELDTLGTDRPESQCHAFGEAR